MFTAGIRMQFIEWSSSLLNAQVSSSIHGANPANGLRTAAGWNSVIEKGFGLVEHSVLGASSVATEVSADGVSLTDSVSAGNHAVLMATTFAVIITMLLALLRAVLGPTVFDRVLALNMFGTKTVLMIAVVSFLTGRSDFLDLALLYSLMNFIGMVALLRFTQNNTFAETSSR